MRMIVRHILITATLLIAASACIAAPDECRLNISNSQKEKLKSLATETRRSTMRERESMRRARYDLLQVFSSNTIDERKAKAAQEKISSAQLNLLNIHLENELALRGLFNATQFQQFRDMMKRHTRDSQTLVIAPPEEDILDRLPNKEMLDELGISADNQKLLTPSNRKLILELRKLSAQTLEMYGNYSLDAASCRKLIGSIHKKQIELLSLQHRRQRTIRTVLSKDQFQSLQRELAKSMAKRNHTHRRDQKP